MKTKLDLAAEQEAKLREKMLRDANDGRGTYQTENEYLANYLGRIGGFRAGVEWAARQKHCNWCREVTDTTEGDCVICGLSKPGE